MTRPGLAPIAAALAVELAVALLHHPLGYVVTCNYMNMRIFLIVLERCSFASRCDVYDVIGCPTQ